MNIPFEQVIVAHGATVLRVCRAALGSGVDADDAWSETFLSAFVAWPDLDEDTNVQAWLVRVAQRKTLDIIRQRSRRPIPTDELPEPVRPDECDTDIWTAVAALPERQRLALAYHYFGGLTHTETAAVIGGTPDAVRRAAADGIKTLRARLTAATMDKPKGAWR